MPPEDCAADIFLPGGKLRPEVLTSSSLVVLKESLRLARETRWESVRSPHLFMGLIADPDPCIRLWGDRVQADLPCLLRQFQDLFHQEDGEDAGVLLLNREFLSDNVIRFLRDALCRAGDHCRQKITPMDLLISMLTAPRSIIAECFERMGVTAAKLTEQAVLAEHAVRDEQ